MNTPTMINTRKVQGRRVLRFATLDEVLADVRAMAAAEEAGTLHHLGNWTLGQICNHLAVWVNYGFDGAPAKVPLPIKLIARLLKNRLLEKGMPSGARLPKAPGGTFGTDRIPTEEGLRPLTAAYARLKSGPPTIPNPAFGRLSETEWTKLHLRHAELHLSFVKEDKATEQS